MKLIITLLFMNFFVLLAQNEDVVIVFNATEFNNKVLLNWTISQGNTCNGIDVFRSVDGVNYLKIGDIEGVCGSTAESIDYNLTDLFPVKNEVNHYRLGLGGLGYSYSVKVEIIDIAANSYQIRPHPISENAQLLFNNDSSKEADLNVYNGKGELIFQKSTNSSWFELNVLSTFPSGLYYFRLNVNENEIKGKIAVP